MGSQTDAPSAKGTVFIPAVMVLQSDLERAKTLLRPELHHYLEQAPIPSAWYPVHDHQALLLAVGEMLRDGLSMDVWEFMGRQAALTTLHRPKHASTKPVYGHVMQPGQAEQNIRRSGMLWSFYYSAGQLTAEVVDAHRVVLTLRDFPSTAPEICRVHTGFMRQAVAIGAQLEPEEVRVDHTDCIHRGAAECAWSTFTRKARVDVPAPVSDGDDDANARWQAAVTQLRQVRPSRGPHDT